MLYVDVCAHRSTEERVLASGLQTYADNASWMKTELLGFMQLAGGLDEIYQSQSDTDYMRHCDIGVRGGAFLSLEFHGSQAAQQNEIGIIAGAGRTKSADDVHPYSGS